MAKYELLEKAFIDNRLWEPGEVIEVNDSVIPGPHMKPLDSAAKKAIREAGVVNGPLPEPVYEITKTDQERAAESLGASPQGVKSGMAVGAQTG